jgi:hypothetical protein
MSKPKVLCSKKIISSNGVVEIEHFDDGELLLTTPDFLSFQFCARAVDEIKSIFNISGTVEKVDASESIRMQVQEDEDGTWGVNVGFDASRGNKVVRYKYKSRSYARKGRMDHKVGEHGRIG